MSSRYGSRGALLLLGALLVPAPTRAAEPDALKDLDAFVEKGLAEWKVPGLSIAVVKDGAVVLSRG